MVSKFCRDRGCGSFFFLEGWRGWGDVFFFFFWGGGGWGIVSKFVKIGIVFFLEGGGGGGGMVSTFVKIGMVASSSTTRYS